MAKPIDLGHVDFKTQTAALGHFKDMLNRYALGEEISPKDHDDLLALIQRHPEAKQKIGCGVQRFVVNMSDKGTRCFWIERTDGSRTDFSYIWAVKGEGPTLYQEFSEACREAVETDLVIGKRNFFEINGDSDGRVKCAVTGELISFDEAHVDHMAPMTFQVIVRTFLAANEDIEPGYHLMTSPADEQFTTTITDSDVRERFRKYHATIAGSGVLRVVKARVNLSQGSKNRIRETSEPVRLRE